jgi:hypothetical protein
MELHTVAEACDAPVVVIVEQRHTPDRRGFWRGGRRNTDWFNRPIGAWRHLEQRAAPWRQWFARLPLPGRLAVRQPEQPS